MNPAEFSDVMLGYIDLDTNEEFIVDSARKFQAERLFPTPSVSQDMSMLSVGLMMTKILVFTALRIKLFIEGNGKLSFRNVEGLAGAAKKCKG